MPTIDPRRETNGRAVAARSPLAIDLQPAAVGPATPGVQATLPGFQVPDPPSGIRGEATREAGRKRARSAARRPSNPRAMLLGSPRTVLARLSTGDPLELRPLAAKRLRQRHLLMDSERVHLGALVHCAREGARYRGQQTFERWLEQRVDHAIDDLLDAPYSEPREPSSAWRDLAQPLGLCPRRMASASAGFNALEPDARAAFFQLVLGRRSLDEWATSTGRSATQLARDARRGLQVFLDAVDPESTSRARTRS